MGFSFFLLCAILDLLTFPVPIYWFMLNNCGMLMLTFHSQSLLSYEIDKLYYCEIMGTAFRMCKPFPILEESWAHVSK